MTTETKDKRAEEQARAQLDSIVKMVGALESGEEIDGQDPQDRIQEDPLSVEVRTDWHSVGAEDTKPTDYNILLCTGGPACRIIGELDEYGQPDSAQIEYQDWFTPWERYFDITHEEGEALLTYAQQFYFAEC